MVNIINKKTFLNVLILSLFVVFTGCSKNALLMKTYTPPKKPKEVNEMLASNQNSDGFLQLEIYGSSDDSNDVYAYIADSNDVARIDAAKKLVSSLQQYITQTEFISLNSVADEGSVSLDMKIIKFDYNVIHEGGMHKLNALFEVTFNIRKNHETFYTQTYSKVIKRQVRNEAKLPQQSEIVSQAADDLAKKLIKDIAPLKTKKLVEFASLPSELEATFTYAKAGNFQKAIDVMQAYKGDKGYEFYFNLAIYYEGLAAAEDDMILLSKCDAYYEKAMQLGGSSDDIVIKGKTQFDKFYNIIKKVAQQKMKNEKNNNKDSKYDIL